MTPGPISGSTASLRPRGAMRYFGAPFLAFWLIGWAVGEVFAIGMLTGIFRSASVPQSGSLFVVLFLTVWLSLWTLGGAAAITQLLRMLAGEDLIALAAGGVAVTRRAGPFRRTRIYNRSAIRRLRMRPRDKAIVIDTDAGTRELTSFGSDEDRKAVFDWLHEQLGISSQPRPVDTAATPRNWHMETDDTGAVRLSRLSPRARTVVILIVWTIAALLLVGWQSSRTAGGPGALPALIFGVLFCLLAIWVTWSRTFWVVSHGSLSKRRRFLSWSTDRPFVAAFLEITTSTDSDGDRRYQLAVADQYGRRTIDSTLHDPGELLDLARWLAARTGFRVELPAELKGM